jgi:RNA polymerase sigma-70 factor (ECF subfamily)
VIEKSWADPEQFAAIFDRYFGQIHRYLARRVGSKLADDLAADVFVAAFAQRTRARPNPPFSPVTLIMLPDHLARERCG